MACEDGQIQTHKIIIFHRIPVQTYFDSTFKSKYFNIPIRDRMEIPQVLSVFPSEKQGGGGLGLKLENLREYNTKNIFL